MGTTTSSSRVRSTVATVRTGVTAGAITLLVGLGAMSVLSAPEPRPSDGTLGLSSRHLDRLLERNRCSTTGFAPEVTPSKALVTDRHGTTRLVSFEEGWRVFTGERPGELVAVCLGPERRRTTTARG